MNTFFRIAVYLSFAMIVFNLAVAFVGSMRVFPDTEMPGTGEVNETGFLSTIATFTGGMTAIWTLITAVGGITAIGISILSRTLTPVGLYLFGTVFWTSYVGCNSILSYGDYIPGEFLAMFFIGMMLIFIAAIIGMLSGSG